MLHAWQKVVQNRQRCYNFFNFHADCTKFSIDIEHIILTNRAVFIFGLFIFWRENDVTNLAPKIYKLAMTNIIYLFGRACCRNIETEV